MFNQLWFSGSLNKYELPVFGSLVCNVGDIVKVKIISVDTERKRIVLSMKTQPGQAKPTLKSQMKKEKRHLDRTGKVEIDINRLAEKCKGL